VGYDVKGAFSIILTGCHTAAWTGDLTVDGVDWGVVSINGPLTGAYFGFWAQNGLGSLYIYGLTVV
jgi:hypothetical protein